MKISLNFESTCKSFTRKWNYHTADTLFDAVKEVLSDD